MAPRRLQLERPLIVFDLETTGRDVVKDRVVEISCVKLNPDGSREVKTRRVNPEMPISPEATQIHGIADADVLNEPTFVQLAKSLFDFLKGADLSGFNVERFDLPMLKHEFARAGLEFPPAPTAVIDTWRIYLAKEPRNLTAAYKHYCDKGLENAHSAEADAVAAADILEAQVERYPDLPPKVSDLHEYCHQDWLDPDGRILWRGDEAVLGFGKHRDRSLRQLAADNPDYLQWIVDKADFSKEVKQIVRAALAGRFPDPPPRPAPNGNGGH
ncbi:MAG: 3'-5' exonuclease [Deltaproteobacteria bacterium]|nr:3'-5' exonuclease [Deltaproteobacteria bacterium]